MSAAEAIDTSRLTGFYVRLYPLLSAGVCRARLSEGLFQRSCRSTVIDHLLAAPEPPLPVYVTQPRSRLRVRRIRRWKTCRRGKRPGARRPRQRAPAEGEAPRHPVRRSRRNRCRLSRLAAGTRRVARSARQRARVDDRRRRARRTAARRTRRRRRRGAETRRAKRVGDGCRRVADEDRCRARRWRSPAQSSAPRPDRRASVPQFLDQRRRERVVGRIRAARFVEQRAERGDGLRARVAPRARRREHITLPEPSQIELTGISR